MISAQDYIQGSARIFFAGTERQYQCYVPSAVNREFAVSNRVAERSEEAMRLIGELNAYSSIVPDVDYFIQMHVRKEAVQSSRIEGTYTDIDDAILDEKEISPERRNDWREVRNYVRALNHSIGRLQDLPLAMRLLNEAHQILLEGTRGDGKTPGQIRTLQNWIGGATINSAIFVPPHAELIPASLTDLENFIHNHSISMPKLVRIAVTHFQFETIHPYADGNGRIGRLLIMLQMMNYGLMKQPTLYMSDFFEKNRQNYYEALTYVRIRQNLDHWLEFFLDGVVDAAQSGKDKFEKILELRKSYDARVLELGKTRGRRANMLLQYLYKIPAVNVSQASQVLGISPSNTNTLINEMVRVNIIKEKTGFSRNRLFVLEEYLQIFRSKPLSGIES
ncbi:MAG TPA: Fic family protein [Candidatus Saccharimonadales bacterium]|jgi:Fic family protein